jgi:hypothetical protein
MQRITSQVILYSAVEADWLIEGDLEEALGASPF